MSKLVYLEFLKLKRSYINIFLFLSMFLPILFIVIQYFLSQNEETFFLTITNNTSTISISIFSIIMILASYIMAREYKENMFSYLFITPNSRTKVLISKLLLLFIVILLLELITFVTLIIIHMFVGEFTMEKAGMLLEAWILSSLMFFLLTPLVVYIVLLRRGFVSSLLILLAGFIFTYPFIYKEYYYFLPHLIPLVTVSDHLGADVNAANGWMTMAIMLGVFFLFTFLSIKKINRKD
ncbi:ABC transporter permease [Paenibacillus bouchesdurhonensis]|uniref:ABC transporter permease n=1 Tax=Paenibacillus bouchesdurhonensis TaxID=1870990 RepID=UPI000DA6113A|nr:ABC transporter permease [Paenibacillus bouchesdurhonensis]